MFVSFWVKRKRYKFVFRPNKKDLLSCIGERISMLEETVEIDKEFLEEEEEEEEGSRDWGKVGIVVMFFLVVVIGYYIIQALS